MDSDLIPRLRELESKAKQYVENWDSFKRDEIGLLLFGDVGTGKTSMRLAALPTL